MGQPGDHLADAGQSCHMGQFVQVALGLWLGPALLGDIDARAEVPGEGSIGTAERPAIGRPSLR